MCNDAYCKFLIHQLKCIISLNACIILFSVDNLTFNWISSLVYSSLLFSSSFSPLCFFSFPLFFPFLFFFIVPFPFCWPQIFSGTNGPVVRYFFHRWQSLFYLKLDFHLGVKFPFVFRASACVAWSGKPFNLNNRKVARDNLRLVEI